MRSFIVSTTLKVALISGCLGAFAQVNLYPGQWVGGLFSVEDKLYGAEVRLIDENNIIREEIRHNGVSIFDVDPANAGKIATFVASSIWHDDALYILSIAVANPEKDAEGALFRRHNFSKWQDGEWHDLGAYKNPHTKSSLKAIPCGNDRFIVVSGQADLAGNTGSQLTPFVRMVVNSDRKEARVQSSIDHGQEELRQHMSNADCFGLAWRSEIIITGNHATLLNRKTGHYWIFLLETASLKKTGNIFKKMTPEMIANGGLQDAVLCAHPEKDGTILISAQAEELFESQGDYVAEMRELHKQYGIGQPHATMSNEEWVRLYEKRRRQATENSPLIDWYRLDPENGKVEKTFPPEGAAIERDGNKNDLWYPKPDGSVRMGILRLNQPEKAEAKLRGEAEEVSAK